jgi:ribonucleoside-triphosphate reductase
VYENFEDISGISFLPHSDHTYAQAPYQAINKDKYKELMKQMPENIDWSKLAEFEKGIDTTSGSKELACTAGVCEVVDIVAT